MEAHSFQAMNPFRYTDSANSDIYNRQNIKKNI